MTSARNTGRHNDSHDPKSNDMTPIENANRLITEHQRIKQPTPMIEVVKGDGFLRVSISKPTASKPEVVTRKTK
jgi:hypothetical protein